MATSGKEVMEMRVKSVHIAMDTKERPRVRVHTCSEWS